MRRRRLAGLGERLGQLAHPRLERVDLALHLARVRVRARVRDRARVTRVRVRPRARARARARVRGTARVRVAPPLADRLSSTRPWRTPYPPANRRNLSCCDSPPPGSRAPGPPHCADRPTRRSSAGCHAAWRLRNDRGLSGRLAAVTAALDCSPAAGAASVASAVTRTGISKPSSAPWTDRDHARTVTSKRRKSGEGGGERTIAYLATTRPFHMISAGPPAVIGLSERGLPWAQKAKGACSVFQPSRSLA